MNGTIRYAGMDGIKGLALIGVIWYHLSQRTLPGGFIGVEVFYTVSGFLLGAGLLESSAHGGRSWLPRFYVRRLARLWPALAAMALCVVPVAALVDTDALVGIGGQSAAALTFSTNWYEIATGGSYFATTSPQLLRHLWFVALMAQVVVLLPAVVALTRRLAAPRLRPVVPAALAVLSVVLMAVLYDPQGDPTRVYFGTDTHCFGMLLGLALAWTLRAAGGPSPLPVALARRTLPWAATAALVMLMAMAVRVGQDESAFRGGLALTAVLTLVLIAGTITKDSWMCGLLEWRPLALLGRHSYGLYLWHWPVFLLVQLALPGWRGRGMWLIWTLTLAFSALAAALSWRIVERPVARWSDRRTGRGGASRDAARPMTARGRAVSRLRAFAAALAAIALAVGFVGAVRSAPGRSRTQIMLENNQAALDAEADRREQDARAQAEARERAEQEAAARAEAKQEALRTLTGEDVTVIGDSVTVGATPALQQALPGVVVDAQTSRFMREAPDIVAALAGQGQLRRYVVVSLNTNSAADQASFERIAAAAGDGHVLVIVNGYGDRSWIPVANQAAADYVRGHPATAALADWGAAIAAHTEWLASDGIHPTEQGAELYAQTVKEAIATWISYQAAAR